MGIPIHAYHPQTGEPVCGANYKDGTYCLNKPSKRHSDGRCHKHRVPIIAKGKIRMDLPTRIEKRFGELSKQSDLADLTDKLVAIHMFFEDKFSKWANAVDALNPEGLAKLHSKLVLAVNTGDMTTIQSVVEQLGKEINSNMLRATYEKDVREIVKEYKDLAAIQNYREVQQDRNLTMKEANQLFALMTRAVIESVADPVVIKNIDEKFHYILNKHNILPAQGGGEPDDTDVIDADFESVEDTYDGAPIGAIREK